MEHTTGLLYIEIIQYIQNRKNDAHKIQLNPAVVSDLIKVLEMYQKKIPPETFLEKSYFSTEAQEKIQNLYLKGIKIKLIGILEHL